MLLSLVILEYVGGSGQRFRTLIYSIQCRTLFRFMFVTRGFDADFAEVLLHRLLVALGADSIMQSTIYWAVLYLFITAARD